jgi:hypothetical protein
MKRYFYLFDRDDLDMFYSHTELKLGNCSRMLLDKDKKLLLRLSRAKHSSSCTAIPFSAKWILIFRKTEPREWDLNPQA